MATDNQLLDEFKELIETVSLEIIKEAQMKEVAKDVVTRSYKAEIADTLEMISGEIDRVKQQLESIDYITENEIKALVESNREKQEADIKQCEEHLKEAIGQSTKELYIANEKMRSEVEAVREQVDMSLREMGQKVNGSLSVLQNMKKGMEEQFESCKLELKEQNKKLFFMNYGLIATVIILLVYVILRGIYGA